MVEGRMARLALMHIHTSDIEIDIDRIFKKFIEHNPRKIV
jgi:hypothetical protein